MQKLPFILIAVLGVTVAQAPTPIPWAPNWSSHFTEAAYLPVKGSHSGITGIFKYQFGNGNQRQSVYRTDGFYDIYCGTVHEFSHTPCQHLVLNNGTRYLIFPRLRDCCLCCTAANGCGPTLPTWFMSGKYVSQTSAAITFSVVGNQENIYAMTPAGVPVQINMVPESNMVFDTTTYSTATLTDQDFALPTDMGNCNKLCPNYSWCGEIRKF